MLTGIPLAARWPELRTAAVGAVLAAARRLADVTVVDCGFCLETDEELSFDSLAPRRNGATLAVLDDADVVLVVGAADPIGMQRLVRGLAELREAEVGSSVQVVLNKVRRGVVPGDPRAELVGALELFSGTTPAALLPYDRDSLDAALATGRSLGEARPASPLRAAVAELAGRLVDRRAGRAIGPDRGAGRVGAPPAGWVWEDQRPSPSEVNACPTGSTLPTSRSSTSRAGRPRSMSAGWPSSPSPTAGSTTTGWCGCCASGSRWRRAIGSG